MHRKRFTNCWFLKKYLLIYNRNAQKLIIRYLWERSLPFLDVFGFPLPFSESGKVLLQRHTQKKEFLLQIISDFTEEILLLGGDGVRLCDARRILKEGLSPESSVTLAVLTIGCLSYFCQNESGTEKTTYHINVRLPHTILLSKWISDREDHITYQCPTTTYHIIVRMNQWRRRPHTVSVSNYHIAYYCKNESVTEKTTYRITVRMNQWHRRPHTI